jgi:hypothetical protein
MDAHAQYRIDALHNRIRELERWQEKAREDIARMERCIVALAEPRSTPNADKDRPPVVALPGQHFANAAFAVGEEDRYSNEMARRYGGDDW